MSLANVNRRHPSTHCLLRYFIEGLGIREFFHIVGDLPDPASLFVLVPSADQRVEVRSSDLSMFMRTTSDRWTDDDATMSEAVMDGKGNDVSVKASYIDASNPD